MKNILLLLCCLSFLISCKPSHDIDFTIIAHRGASGYLPEHTLEAKAMAYGMKPDFIEQDVAITKDNRAIVIHDHYLDTVTNVADIYPNRKRNDGRYYAIDFTLDEIKELKVRERFDLKSGEQVFPGRFPTTSICSFEIPTLEEEIELIQGLNKSTGKNIGIYVELKAPWFHKDEGKDIAKIVLDILSRYGYTERSSNCILQSFDPQCLKYIHHELKSELRLVQLISDNSWNETPGVDYNAMLTIEGLKKISEYADGIGPWINLIVKDMGKGNDPVITTVIEDAHSQNLIVHPFTFRADDLPSYVSTMDELLDIFLFELKADGVFTDFPDQGVKFLETRGLRN